jgi:hypothetical protein
MDSSLATIAMPIRTPHGYWRLLSLVGALVTLVTAPWWLLLPSMPTYSYFGVRVFVPAATSAALFMFAVVTALMDMRQRIRWLAVLVVVIAERLLPLVLLIWGL